MPCVALAPTRSRRRSLQATVRSARKSKLPARFTKNTKKASKSRSAQASSVASSAHSDVAHSSTSPTSSATTQPTVRLKDGDRIQIRPHRSLSQTSAAASSIESTTKTRSQHPSKSLRRRFRRPSRAALINAESRLGSQIFGPIPAGHRREFFHDRDNVWIWHESWTDSSHHHRQITVRYEAHPTGVYKKVSAGKYLPLQGAELENFRKATRAYLQLIKRELYQQV